MATCGISNRALAIMKSKHNEQKVENIDISEKFFDYEHLTIQTSVVL